MNYYDFFKRKVIDMSYWSLEPLSLSDDSYMICLLCGEYAKLYRGKFFQCRRKDLHFKNGSRHPKWTRSVKRCTKVGTLEWIPNNRKEGVDISAKKLLKSIEQNKSLNKKSRKKKKRK